MAKPIALLMTLLAARRLRAAFLIALSASACAEPPMQARYNDAITHLPWVLNKHIERFRFTKGWDSDDVFHYSIAAPGSEMKPMVARPIPPSIAPDVPASPDDRRWNHPPRGVGAIRHEGSDLVFVRDTHELRLTSDGTPDLGYGLIPDTGSSPVTRTLEHRVKPPFGFWSRDGRFFATTLLDQRGLRSLPTLVNLDRGATHQVPRAFQPRVALPGDDRVPTARIVIFDTTTGKRVDVNVPPLMVAYDAEPMGGVRWSDDARTLFVGHETRNFKTLTIYRVDTQTGKSQPILTETGATTLRAMDTDVETNPKMFEIVGNGDELILYSERDDYPHLFLYDARTGRLKRQLTRGPWYVHSMVHVDAVHRVLYFLAGGREPARDPYFSHLYAVNLDRGTIRLVTPENADHDVRFASSGRYFVDSYSTAELVDHVVMRASDGRVLQTLSHPDRAPIDATGWKPGIQFTVKAADGMTDLYGVLYLPPGDTAPHSVPIIDAVYAGSQVTSRPKRFLQDWILAQAVSRLGFATFILDARGTPRRTQTFQDVSFGPNFGSREIMADHIAAIQQLAARYPVIDTNRVGIYGHSWGGYRAARAMFQFPDVFKVGVAMAGSHDNYLFTYEHDRWFGYPPEYPGTYEEQSNLPLAQNLKGKLLLIHGDQDDQVPLANTLQLADALIAANRDFDMLVVPGSGHPLEANGYVIRRTWDYFVTNLLGATPPRDFEVPGD
jgi:dipeptidyl aminopeptidase/acylaminoacyl peptidase